MLIIWRLERFQVGGFSMPSITTTENINRSKGRISNQVNSGIAGAIDDCGVVDSLMTDFSIA